MQQRRTHDKENRQSLYAAVTDKIVGELEAGRLPWVQPWGGANPALGMPQNGATRRRYSGINILILWGAVIEQGFAQQAWLTFRQALALGGAVRKGERGTTVVFADRFVPKNENASARLSPRDQDGQEPDRSVPFLRRFTLFNIEQCDGLPPELYAQAAPAPQGLIVPEAEALIHATGAKFRIAGDRAFYDPARDTVVVPPPQAFFEPINWHRTAFHELGHWTGHESRLAREQSGANGSKAYAREELVAEMAGAFVCASLNIVPTVRHADYLGEWLTILREDARAIFRAASAASKAADYLLAFRSAAEARQDRNLANVDPSQPEIPLVVETQR